MKKGWKKQGGRENFHHIPFNFVLIFFKISDGNLFFTFIYLCIYFCLHGSLLLCTDLLGATL